MFKLFSAVVSLGCLLSNVAAATTQVVVTEGTQTSPLFNSGYNIFRLISSQEVCPMRVDLRSTSFERLNDQILQAASSRGLVSLDLSGKQLHDESLEALVDSLSEPIQKGQLKNIAEIDLSNNALTVESVQSLIPIMLNPTFKRLNVSSNRLEGADLFERLGTNAAYSDYVSSEDRILLDLPARKDLMQKLIWIPRGFFNPSDKSDNPSGLYVTPEVIFQHREYYNLAR
jgi:hypothetical protein